MSFGASSPWQTQQQSRNRPVGSGWIGSNRSILDIPPPISHTSTLPNLSQNTPPVLNPTPSPQYPALPSIQQYQPSYIPPNQPPSQLSTLPSIQQSQPSYIPSIQSQQPSSRFTPASRSVFQPTQTGQYFPFQQQQQQQPPPTIPQQQQAPLFQQLPAIQQQSQSPHYQQSLVASPNMPQQQPPPSQPSQLENQGILYLCQRCRNLLQETGMVGANELPLVKYSFANLRRMRAKDIVDIHNLFVMSRDFCSKCESQCLNNRKNCPPSLLHNAQRRLYSQFNTTQSELIHRMRRILEEKGGRVDSKTGLASAWITTDTTPSELNRMFPSIPRS